MKVLLATLHAKYVHASLALPCLASACRDITGVETVIREFTVNEPADQVLRRIVAEEADVAAFSCYIWNIRETLQLAADLKKVLPRTFIILGGPEASFGVFDLLSANQAIDCVIREEGEETFQECMGALTASPGKVPSEVLLSNIEGITFRAGDEIIANPPRRSIRDLDTIPSPFGAGLVDLDKPLVYYESSRGCPFSCAFCMSSLEKGVRSFTMERIRADLGLLMERGVKTVKFVDRTFNYDAARANAIWEFILRSNRESRFHFEIAADLLTDDNIRILREVPEGVFRFEIGVQSGGEETLERVGRKSDLEKLFATVRRLREETGVTLHLDLVAGLPEENYPGFLASLDRLFAVSPHHIQVEPLKVLKGSPMRRIAAEEEYAFSDTPPYKILHTPWLSFADIGRIETVSRLLDLYYNSGRCRTSLAFLAQHHPLSHVFDKAAQYWEENALQPNLSLIGLFGEFWRFAARFVEEGELENLRDALCYDFCLAECPGAGKMPEFFMDAREIAGGGKRRVDTARLARLLGLSDGSRIRTFVRRFTRDYRFAPWKEGPAELLFIYASAPGLGLRVEVLDSGSLGLLPKIP